MKLGEKIRQYREARRQAKLETLGLSAQTIYHFLSDPSQREIAAALGMPKSTVNDAIQRLKKNGIQRGAWTV